MKIDLRHQIVVSTHNTAQNTIIPKKCPMYEIESTPFLLCHKHNKSYTYECSLDQSNYP